MRPVTDRHHVSRAKLAYLIDATAAPICIIAPISSWAAAVTGFVENEDGFAVFINAIPYNYYALLTIVAMVAMVIMKVDYGPMKLHEENAVKGDLYTTKDRPYANVASEENGTKGTVTDLVLPVAVLIISCVIGMIYTGGFFNGAGFVEAFSASDASVGLMLGSFVALIITILFYLVRHVVTFKKACECIPEGFKAMVPAILILTFAWTLKAMTDSLGAKEYVASVIAGMSGAVCGDHCSPISDTTIMASAGAQCNHMNHVSTQIPYVVLVAAISFVSYLVAGFVKNAVVPLVVGIMMVIGALSIVKYTSKTSDTVL